MKFGFVVAALFAVASAHKLGKEDRTTGDPIPICNGANSSNCVEASVVIQKRIRRPHKRAAPGDPDFAAQEAADKARLAA